MEILDCSRTFYVLEVSKMCTLQWNLSYLGDLVPTAACILEMSVTKNKALKYINTHN